MLFRNLTVFLIASGILGCSSHQSPSNSPPLTSTTTSHPACDVVSEDGKYTLHLCQVTPEVTTINPNQKTVSLYFDFSPIEPAGSVTPSPRGWYLDAINLRQIHSEDGRDLSSAPHSIWTGNFAPSVTLYLLEVPTATDQLTNLEFAVTVIKVSQWNVKKYPALGLPESDFLKCGPFELKTDGDPKAFHVQAAALSEFFHEHETFSRQVPVSFLNHDYAVNQLDIIDSAGHHLSHSQTAATGSTSCATYILGGALRRTDRPSSDPHHIVTVVREEILPIAYPVTITLPIPTRYTQETVVFKLKNVPIPNSIP